MDICGPIFGLCQKVCAVAEATRVNQCRLLAERVQSIEAALKEIGPPNNGALLLRLHNCIQDCLNQIQQYTGDNWFERAYLNLVDQDAFLGLHEQLDRCVHDLNLAVCLKQTPDLQRKVNSIEEDLMDIKAMAGKILKLIHRKSGGNDSRLKTAIAAKIATVGMVISQQKSTLKTIEEFRDFIIDSNETDW
ncbi:hypothetical protein BKA69DRAFT_1043109 [Paraphysoderma sedebokerense]|nr:hypothetical protein BKA69DRAFT_1043109 [Paraphysoderma sedebokerense]